MPPGDEKGVRSAHPESITRNEGACRDRFAYRSNLLLRPCCQERAEKTHNKSQLAPGQVYSAGRAVFCAAGWQPGRPPGPLAGPGAQP
jgi:hypothetical protein